MVRTLHYTLSLRVFVETLAALLPIPPCVYHALQENTGAVFGVPGAYVERLLDG